MRKITTFLLLIISFPVFSQDPSFSQSDLGSIYMNPAYTGASGDPTFLSIRRMQWNNYNTGGIRPFTTSLAEFSVAIDAGDGVVGLRTIGIGTSYMAEDHMFSPDLLSNTIFLKRNDYQVYLSGLFKVGTTKSLFRKKNSGNIIHYIQPAISYGQSVYGLQTDGIVTSSMITPYTLSYSGLPNSTININDLAIDRKPFHKLVIGILHSAQGNTNSSKFKRTESGIAFQRMTEGFNNNPLTSKITLHTKHQGSTPAWNSEMIPYWNAFAKREIYYSGSPFIDKIMAKTEIGGSLELGIYSILELGSLFRFNSDYTDDKFDVNWQTISPFIRFNMRGRRHNYQLSWCSDIESTFFTNQKNDLYIKNTGITNEISLTITFWGGNGPKECIKYGYMKQNGLLQGLKKNKFLNK
tara:strand:+ start:30 stop:1256 length:1227 start_codon:yes stop_codon:yes gene_type:complete